MGSEYGPSQILLGNQRLGEAERGGCYSGVVHLKNLYYESSNICIITVYAMPQQCGQIFLSIY